MDYKKILTKGNRSSLEQTSVEEGTIRFTKDTSELFIDSDGTRHQITDVVKGYTEAEIKSLLAPIPKIYLSKDTHKFLIYLSGKWIVVGKNEWVGTKAEFKLAVKNGEILDGMTIYITDDYSGEGQDLSEYAKVEYVNDTFVPLEEGKGLSSTDVTSDDVERWNTSSDIATRLDGDATVDGSVAQKIAEVVSGAPEKYDTLVEIANWIESDTDGAAAMDLKISENAKNIELKLDKDGGDTADNVTTFTSNDASESTSWTNVDVMSSGEKHSGLFSKISTMFKNMRYLYKLLGTTDISTVGDGTVSGAISTLNSNMSSSTKHASVTGAGWYRIAKYAVSDGSSKVGAGDNSVDVVIQRNYNNEDNEHHEFKVMSIYNHQEFVDVCNKSNVHRFTKARYTYDSDGAYIEVRYSSNTVNDFRITLSNTLSGSRTTHWEPICEKTSETVDGVTITATYDIPSYSAVTQLKTQIDTLNSNMINYQRWAIAAGETRRVLVREAAGTGNLVLFSTYFAIPSYKTIFLASSGNGNNINSGQNITITKLLESSVVAVTPVNEDGKYNCFDIKNNGTYNVILHANTLYGTPPIMY